VVKPLEWVGSSKKDLLAMPDPVIDVVGYALHLAQQGLKHNQVKALKGFGSAGVLEVIEDAMAMRTERSIRFASRMPYMCCIASRRNPTRASRRQSKRWMSSRRD
jgi:phage-related protein